VSPDALRAPVHAGVGHRAMPRKARVGECVYCGAVGEVTRDHVPPKCLFPPSDRVNLVTVRACYTCNAGFKLDDEYFRVLLAMRADLPEGEGAEFLRDQTNRALRHPSAKQFRDSILAATRAIPIHTQAGVYLGHTPALKLDAARIRSTADRIVRGLYSKYIGWRLPDSHAVSVNPLDFQRNNSAIESPEVRELADTIWSQGAHKSFGNTLDLRFMQAGEDPSSSLWLVRLHGVFQFLGFTLPKDGQTET